MLLFGNEDFTLVEVTKETEVISMRIYPGYYVKNNQTVEWYAMHLPGMRFFKVRFENQRDYLDQLIRRQYGEESED